MTTKGIIFSAPMVRALLAGTKMQTRRLIEPTSKPTQPGDILISWPAKASIRQGARFRPPYAPGDRLYVRERLWVTGEGVKYGRAAFENPFAYNADVNHIMHPGRDLWLRKFNPDRAIGIPAIHMPRWASRLWLEVTEVRVQRLQDISGNDARQEGIEHASKWPHWRDYEGRFPHMLTPRESFQTLWSTLHTKPGQRWEDNPWIVAVSFTVHHGNVDEVGHG